MSPLYTLAELVSYRLRKNVEYSPLCGEEKRSSKAAVNLERLQEREKRKTSIGEAAIQAKQASTRTGGATRHISTMFPGGNRSGAQIEISQVSGGEIENSKGKEEANKSRGEFQSFPEGGNQKFGILRAGHTEGGVSEHSVLNDAKQVSKRQKTRAE